MRGKQQAAIAVAGLSPFRFSPPRSKISVCGNFLRAFLRSPRVLLGGDKSIGAYDSERVRIRSFSFRFSFPRARIPLAACEFAWNERRGSLGGPEITWLAVVSDGIDRALRNMIVAR